MSCRLADRYRRFGEKYFLHLQSHTSCKMFVYVIFLLAFSFLILLPLLTFPSGQTQCSEEDYVFYIYIKRAGHEEREIIFKVGQSLLLTIK
jgi:hypothetical protein